MKQASIFNVFHRPSTYRSMYHVKKRKSLRRNVSKEHRWPTHT